MATAELTNSNSLGAAGSGLDTAYKSPLNPCIASESACTMNPADYQWGNPSIPQQQLIYQQFANLQYYMSFYARYPMYMGHGGSCYPSMACCPPVCPPGFVPTYTPPFAGECAFCFVSVFSGSSPRAMHLDISVLTLDFFNGRSTQLCMCSRLHLRHYGIDPALSFVIKLVFC